LIIQTHPPGLLFNAGTTLERQKKPSVASSFDRLLPTFVLSRQRSTTTWTNSRLVGHVLFRSRLGNDRRSARAGPRWKELAWERGTLIEISRRMWLHQSGAPRLDLTGERRDYIWLCGGPTRPTSFPHCAGTSRGWSLVKRRVPHPAYWALNGGKGTKHSALRPRISPCDARNLMGSFNGFVPGYTAGDCGPLRGPSY